MRQKPGEAVPLAQALALASAAEDGDAIRNGIRQKPGETTPTSSFQGAASFPEDDSSLFLSPQEASPLSSEEGRGQGRPLSARQGRSPGSDRLPKYGLTPARSKDSPISPLGTASSSGQTPRRSQGPPTFGTSPTGSRGMKAMSPPVSPGRVSSQSRRSASPKGSITEEEDGLPNWLAWLSKVLRQKGGGSVLRGWRLHLDPHGNGHVAYKDFLVGCRQLGFSAEGTLIWSGLRPSKGAIPRGPALEFRELDPDESSNLERFAELLRNNEGDLHLDLAWHKLDVGAKNHLSLQSFCDQAAELCFDGDAALLFRGLDTPGFGRLCYDDFIYLGALCKRRPRSAAGSPRSARLRSAAGSPGASKSAGGDERRPMSARTLKPAWRSNIIDFSAQNEDLCQVQRSHFRKEGSIGKPQDLARKDEAPSQELRRKTFRRIQADEDVQLPSRQADVANSEMKRRMLQKMQAQACGRLEEKRKIRGVAPA